MLEVHIAAPMTWSAALVPPLSGCAAELVMHEPGAYPARGQSNQAAVCVLHVDSSNLVEVAGWMEEAVLNLPSSGKAVSLPSLLVVVGADALRYQWQLRELGAADVVGHVWEAPRVASMVHRHLSRLPQPAGRWPAWIHKRLGRSE